ncbi:hypothetical protein SAMN05421504_104596 [Amycolatopsis xylanica]|uniref:DUF6879 domain-containing protein n=1 Tax=Amycolatopsis xylanica TaxID=589385 RepID=A0A1H3HDR5_9PSEU|nr:DUF6879 family protein [Amycolatopsis xylanica]SDY12789.1 hypothetical protein SAMN05421504_104596 [Amycolatopsis xylanica]
MRRSLNAGTDFSALLKSVRRSSWRWECQREYAVDLPEVERWRKGLSVLETEEDRAWLAHLGVLKAAGIPFERVRMLTEPLTDYLAWMLQAIGPNVAAGEDVRWLKESTARELGMPHHDFYLLDETSVAELRFTEENVLTAVVVDDDTAVVAEHQRWRRAAWSAAIPHAELRIGR